MGAAGQYKRREVQIVLYSMTEDKLNRDGFDAVASQKRKQTREVKESTPKRAKVTTAYTKWSTMEPPQGVADLTPTGEACKNQIKPRVHKVRMKLGRPAPPEVNTKLTLLSRMSSTKTRTSRKPIIGRDCTVYQVMTTRTSSSSS